MRLPKLNGLAVLGMLCGGLTWQAGCATPHGAFNYSAEPDPRKHQFVLGPSDVLRVTVWHNPDLSAEPIVRPDGTITLPLIGDLRAGGLTAAQVRDHIAERLKTFVKDDAATVTVAVSAVNSYRFTLVGNVEKPGSFSSTRFVLLSEAMALAGGPNRFASPENTVIERFDPGAQAPRRIPIDYPRILSGKSPEQDLPIVAGDIVYVP